MLDKNIINILFLSYKELKKHIDIVKKDYKKLDIQNVISVKDTLHSILLCETNLVDNC